MVELLKSLVPSVPAHGEPGPKCPGSIKKSVVWVELLKSLVPSVLAHGEPGPKCPGSIKKSVVLVELLKSLVPSVPAHGEPGPKCPGSIKKSVVLVELLKSLVPSVLAQLRSLLSGLNLSRTWSQVSWFDGEVCFKSVIWVKVSKNIGVLRVLTRLQRFRLSWGISFLFPLSLFCCSFFSVNCSLWDTFPVFLFQFQMGFSLFLR